MARAGCLMLQTPAGWRLVAMSSSDVEDRTVTSANPQEISDAVTSFVGDAELSGKQIVLALSAESVLTGTFVLDSNHRRNHQMLTYELESQLPWPAEEVTADFQCVGEHCFGVATETAGLESLVTTLERNGLRVQSISPLAILAVQQLHREVGLKGFGILVWQEADHCEMMQLKEGRLHGWRRTATDPESLRRGIALASIECVGDERALLINASAELEETVADEFAAERISADSLETFAVRAATEVAQGSHAAWIELRRDSLAGGDRWRSYRGELNWLAAATAALLLAITIASWARMVSIDRAINAHRSQQETYFRETFPASRVPRGIVSRMRSEQTNLVGAHAASNRLTLPSPALNTLLRVLRGAPNSERCVVRELEIQDGRLDLDAELRSLSEANLLAAALRREGFSIDTPTTTQSSDQVVTTRIYGSLADEEEAAATTSAEEPTP